MGACASCGGVFNNYAIVQGVDKIIPVDVFIPGCPPTPEMLLFGFNELQRKIREGVPNPPDPLKASGMKLVGPIGEELERRKYGDNSDIDGSDGAGEVSAGCS